MTCFVEKRNSKGKGSLAFSSINSWNVIQTDQHSSHNSDIPFADGLMKLLRDMGSALLALSHFDCRRAVQCIEALPPHQRATTWPLSALARAYFEMTEYKKVGRIDDCSRIVLYKDVCVPRWWITPAFCHEISAKSVLRACRVHLLAGPLHVDTFCGHLPMTVRKEGNSYKENITCSRLNITAVYITGSWCVRGASNEPPPSRDRPGAL